MSLREELERRILLKDGSYGAALANTPAGRDLPFSELLNVKNPDAVLDLHLKFIDSGIDVLTTNSFTGHPEELRQWGFESKAFEINLKAAQLAKKAVGQTGKKIFIAGSMGSTGVNLFLQKGNADFNQMKEGFKTQARALIEGGVDYILIETIHDPINAKAAYIAVLELIDEGLETGIALSLTVNLNGASLCGQTVSSFVVSSTHVNPIYLGLNCSLGPESLRGPLEDLHAECPFPTAIVPNAGLPDEHGNFKISPDEFAMQMQPFLEKGLVNLIGGCCGTSPEHIKALAKIKDKYETRKIRGNVESKIAGLDSVELKQCPSPLVVGERANTLGSRKFKGYVEDGNREKVIEVLRNQERTGAHALDVCLASRDHDEVELWKKFAPSFASLVRAPIFVDSININALETAFLHLAGKPVVNSVNLEDGGENIKRIAALLKRHPAKVIAGMITAKGMAKTLEEKLDASSEIYETLISSGIPSYDIILDPLVFPVSTGVHPMESIKAIPIFKERYPQSHTILGISNISFGLPAQVRGILNSVYLKMALKAGLDIAIVNVNELARSENIDEELFELANRILSNNDQNALIELIERSGKEPITIEKDNLLSLPPEERIQVKIVSGIRDGLADDLDTLTQKMSPMEIINGPLMKGMEKVGEMFGEGKLIISEVLLSAEVFREAMTRLMYIGKDVEIPDIGKIILATVKGDVHDIGKNLVGMILESHGFKVIDLGTQVSPEELAAHVQKEKPFAIGLSGLLIRSAHVMREIAELFTRLNIDVPMVVGGAALTNEFTVKNIAPAYKGKIVRYAKDCLEAVKIFKGISEGQIIPETISVLSENELKISATVKACSLIVKPPQPPDFERHVVNPIAFDNIVPHLNWKSLLTRHMGVKGEKEKSIRDKLEKFLNEIVKDQMITPKAVFQFFKAYSDVDVIVLTDVKSDEIGRLTFKRSSDGICASDWIRKDASANDNIALMVTTSGSVIERSRELRDKNELFFSYALESFALEFAEASAKWVHNQIRELWKLEDIKRGDRLSPGYPSIPDLESQKTIFRLLNPSDIGVTLTEGMMMNPEASVSAIVFHHPEARPYTVRRQHGEST